MESLRSTWPARTPTRSGAGHSFFIFLGDGFFPVNVLGCVRAVPEVCQDLRARQQTPLKSSSKTDGGRAVLGVVDGASPLGIETDADIRERRELLSSATSCRTQIDSRTN
ncbi:adenosine-specific kinase [Cupriavidus basilensis]